MGSHDRDYAPRGPRYAVRPPLPPVTKWILILNVGIFFIDAMLTRRGDLWGPIGAWGCFNVAGSVFGGRVWEFITFQFLHGSFVHLLFNSLGIFFIAPFVEQWWGSRRFLAFYLLCGVAGAMFYTLLAIINLLPGTDPYLSNLVGASAGLFGLLVGVYVIAPAVRVHLLFPPIELSMKQLVLALVSIAVVVIVGGLFFPRFPLFWNSGGEAGHLGGAIMGFVLMKYPGLLGRGRSNIVRPKQFRRRGEPKIRPRTEIDLEQTDEVDRILDKISQHGFDSLTREERDLLAKAAEKKS